MCVYCDFLCSELVLVVWCYRKFVRCLIGSGVLVLVVVWLMFSR